MSGRKRGVTLLSRALTISPSNQSQARRAPFARGESLCGHPFTGRADRLSLSLSRAVMAASLVSGSRRISRVETGETSAASSAPFKRR